MAPMAEPQSRSPWLDIPLADYEGHMSDPGIGQSRMLADQFAHLLEAHRPDSVAILGCAGGNGLDRLRADVTRRVVCIDINPQYIERLAARYAAVIPGIEVHVRDVEQPLGGIAPVDLIYIPLVFEYVDPGTGLRNLRAICRPGGILAAMLQLPCDHAAAVSESPFTSMRGLAAAMRLVAPAELAAAAAAAGFLPRSEGRVHLPSGKAFSIRVFDGPSQPGVDQLIRR